jgi:hypothetical protein
VSVHKVGYLVDSPCIFYHVKKAKCVAFWNTCSATNRVVEQVQCYPIKDEKDYFGNYKGPLRLYQKSGFELHKEIGNDYIYRKYLKAQGA